MLTTLSLTVFTQRNFVANFLQVKCDFRQKTVGCVLESPFEGLEATYDVHLKLIAKRVQNNLKCHSMDYTWRLDAVLRNVSCFVPQVF